MSYNEDNGMTTIGLPTIMYADLHRHFSFAAAWSSYIGWSIATEEALIDGAATDNAPGDVVFSSGWRAWAPKLRAQMPEHEANGWVYIVRDEQGQPVRVWLRAEGLALTTHQVSEMAERIRQTGSPWSADTDDDDDDLPAMDGTNTI